MKKKRIKSAIPIYLSAAVWLLLGLVCPGMLLKAWFLVAAALLSVVVYFIGSRKFPGREVEVRKRAASGDKAIDVLIEEARKRLDSLKKADIEIPDTEISRNLSRMVRAGEEILVLLEKDVRQAQAVRRFMNFYLPTTEKLMNSYRAMMGSESAGENTVQAMKSVENSLGMIADAFEKQLDNLNRSRKLDIETDIEVLETMMAGDGLIDKNTMDEKTAQAGS